MSAPSAHGVVTPDAATFAEQAAQRRVIPVMTTVLADDHTPVSLYRVLAQERPGTFLLESAEAGRSWSRYSFIGVRSAAMLTGSPDGTARWVGRPPVGIPDQGIAVEVLRDTVAALATPSVAGLPPFTSGMVGFIAYDAVRRWERLPDRNPDELVLPELAMLLATDIAVLDHMSGTVWLIANAINFDNSPERVDEAYADAVRRLERMTADLSRSRPAHVTTFDPSARPQFRSRTDPADYKAGVERAREHIRAGDAFQIVLSQRFDIDCPASALDVYRVLRTSNPSPYMYLLRIPDPSGSDLDGAAAAFDVVGSSPEALVTVRDGRCLMHPIAGTRPRSEDPETDAALAEELLADDKERAEHLMLVDLGRNDLGRVCAPGTVEVVEFMAVERYSHVMHLVSTVVGELAADRTTYDVLAATFPAGTLSGAPKVRAMEIIDDLEPVRRGLYGGAVGYLDFDGGLDTAIAIRTAIIRDGVAYVQAGAGLVADSDPEAEHNECRHKAAAVLRAVAVASTMEPTEGSPDDE
jgi:anthranilate synthase component 1